MATKKTQTFNIFDCETTKADEGTKMQIIDPRTGEETGAWIQVRGYDSAFWQEYKNKQTQKHVDAMFNKKGKQVKKTIDLKATKEEEDKGLASLIVTWDNLAPDFPYSEENAYKLVSNPRLSYVRTQLMDYLDDIENFM